MRTMLLSDVGLHGHALVFHDRPPASFRRQTTEEAHELFARLPVFSRDSLPADFFPSADPLATPFTRADPLQGATWLEGRPALLCSATSWTADEDFSVLLEALGRYEAAARSDARSDASLPRLIVVITGKGALKAPFEREVARLEAGEGGWTHVRVRTAWLARDDYPRLLGSADLGVSLHDSTSGADLPMKVVDGFGCGVPVVARRFACVGELVVEGRNGRTFETPSEFAERIRARFLAVLALWPPLTAGIRICRTCCEAFRSTRTASWTGSGRASRTPRLCTPGRSGATGRRTGGRSSSRSCNETCPCRSHGE